MSFDMTDLSVSTMWNYRKASCGEELVDQLLELGFHRIELNYQVKAEWIPGIEKRIAACAVGISSVHNVFPKVTDARFGTDSVLLGYPDEQLRKQAVRLSIRSIEYACRLGAKAVVFHPTEVPLDPGTYDIPLKKMAAEGMKQTDAFRNLRRKMLEERKTGRYLEAMMRSLSELAGYVAVHRLPVKLGMENRAMCHQIPVYPEFEVIAEEFDGGPVGIWLDTGHGIMMQELGLQELPLPPVVERNIIGMHIHDAAKGLDHYAPCTLEGNVLEPFREYIRSAPIRVLELSGRLSAEEIRLGTGRFLEQFGISG